MLDWSDLKLDHSESLSKNISTCSPQFRRHPSSLASRSEGDRMGSCRRPSWTQPTPRECCREQVVEHKNECLLRTLNEIHVQGSAR